MASRKPPPGDLPATLSVEEFRALGLALPGPGRRRGKYNAEPTWVGQIRFASKKEAARYQELLILAQAGVISDLTLQHRFPLIVYGVKVCVYVADFRYRLPGATSYTVEDAKGLRTDVYRLKRKLMWAVYRIEIQEV